MLFKKNRSKDFTFINISKKINTLIGISLFILLMLISMLTLNYYNLHKKIHSQMEDEISEHTYFKYKLIEESINEIYTLLQNTVKDVPMDYKQNQDALLHYLNNLIGDGFIEEIIVTDTKGNSKSSNSEEYFSPASNEYKTLLSGKPYISKPYFRDKTGESMIAFNIPIYENDNIKFFISALKNMSDFLPKINCQAHEHTAKTYIINEMGDILITSSEEESFMNKNIFTTFSSYISEMKNGSDNTLFSGDSVTYVTHLDINNNELALVTTTVSNDLDIQLATLVNCSLLLNKEQSLLIKTIIVSNIIIILTAFILILFIYRYINRLKQINRLTFNDNLTNLPNIHGFEYKLKSLLKDNYYDNSYILYFDINEFKHINSFYSNTIGDYLLKSIATEITSVLDDKTELCARKSDDIFVCYTSSTEKITTALNKVVANCKSNNINMPVVYKIGVYKLEDKKEPICEMINKAILARNIIKENPVESIAFYNESIENAIILKKKIESSKDYALKNNEFKVYLQPKIDLLTGKIVSAEALVRWINSEQTLFFPNEFIPIFEKDGFIKTLDLYMLEQVCSILEERLNKGEKIIPISLNQSRLMFIDDSYISKVSYN